MSWVWYVCPSNSTGKFFCYYVNAYFVNPDKKEELGMPNHRGEKQEVEIKCKKSKINGKTKAMCMCMYVY